MNNMDGFTKNVVILLVAFMVTLAAITAVVAFAERDAVCHSASEDSPITDCDYRDGGWYMR